MKAIDYIPQRNREIIAVFRNIIARSSSVELYSLADEIAKSPASRFWVSEEHAARILLAMASGRPLPPMRPLRRAMFDEIYRRFCNIRRQHPERSVAQIAREVINQPAPQFYVSPRTIRGTIYSLRKNHVQRLSNI